MVGRRGTARHNAQATRFSVPVDDGSIVHHLDQLNWTFPSIFFSSTTDEPSWASSHLGSETGLSQKLAPYRRLSYMSAVIKTKYCL